MAKPPSSAATRRNGSRSSARRRRMSEAVRSANPSFQSAPSSPAAEQVVEHAVAQRALGDLHVLDAELVEGGGHDGDAAGKHRRAVRPQSRNALWLCFFFLDQFISETIQSLARDAVLREAVLAQ